MKPITGLEMVFDDHMSFQSGQLHCFFGIEAPWFAGSELAAFTVAAGCFSLPFIMEVPFCQHRKWHLEGFPLDDGSTMDNHGSWGSSGLWSVLGD